MARGKRANAETPPPQGVETVAPKEGHNSKVDLTDDQRQALHWEHKRGYQKFLAAKKKADADLRNQCKLIKAEGGSLKAIKLSIELESPEGEDAFRARMAEMNEIAHWNGVGIQVEMFADERTPAVDKAREDGKRAGLRGESAKPPHDPSVPQYAAWMEGHAEGQTVVAKGFKPLTPVEQAAAH